MLPTQPDPSTLQSNPPPVQRNYSLSLRVAVACGAMPLLVGVSIFLGWLATKWIWLMPAGIITIYVGCVMFVVGSIALAVYLFANHNPPSSRRRRWIDGSLVALLLISNFPAAFGIMAAVITLETRYVVTIHNASTVELKDARVVGGGCDVSFGLIKPNETATRALWFRHDDELKLTARLGKESLSGVVEGYVTNGMGGSAEVEIDDRGTIRVTHAARNNFVD